MNRKEAMLRKLGAADFALWEMHLYLDTHPWDLQMVEAYNRAYTKQKLLRSDFEENFFPLTAEKAQGFEWLKGPWPWDAEECGC